MAKLCDRPARAAAQAHTPGGRTGKITGGRTSAEFGQAPIKCVTSGAGWGRRSLSTSIL